MPILFRWGAQEPPLDIWLCTEAGDQVIGPGSPTVASRGCQGVCDGFFRLRMKRKWFYGFGLRAMMSGDRHHRRAEQPAVGMAVELVLDMPSQGLRMAGSGTHPRTGIRRGGVDRRSDAFATGIPQQFGDLTVAHAFGEFQH